MEVITAPGRGRGADYLADGPGRHGVDFEPGADYFAARRESFGAHAIHLRIGPLRFRIDGLGRDQLAILGERYRPFLESRPAAGRPDLAIHLVRAGVPGFLALPAGAWEYYRLGRRSRAGVEDFWSYEFAGTYSEASGEAELALVSPAGPLFDRGVENFLRPLTAIGILDRGGLLLHGAGVVRSDRAQVFFGPSGSGKTTVTRLSPRDVILSDDLTLLVADGDRYRAAGIPFGMAHHRVPDTNDAFPIGGLYRLVQSKEVRRERMGGAEALAEVIASLPFVNADGPRAARALAAASRLLDRVPVWRLLFREDDTFWQVVEEGA